ncbi:MAG: hypothetical protein FWF49_03900 [Oscillospiraceae bacterium]|nr:hypothetical protein [Oscillospiraceae bacterium]
MKTNPSVTPGAAIPDWYKSYMGKWQDTTDDLNDLTISINEDDTFTLEVGIFRVTTIDATARIEGDNLIHFYGNAEGDGSIVNGILSMGNNSILFVVTRSDFEYLSAGLYVNFSIKADNGA